MEEVAEQLELLAEVAAEPMLLLAEHLELLAEVAAEPMMLLAEHLQHLQHLNLSCLQRLQHLHLQQPTKSAMTLAALAI